MGKLVAKVYLENPLKGGRVLDIAKLIDFNRGEYPLGDYRNADFFALLRNERGESELIFVELTKEGDLLTEDAKGIKYGASDVSLSVSEDISFEDYLRQILEIGEKTYKTLPFKAYGELKKLLQVLVYSADYLTRSPFAVDRLRVLIAYPVKDAFSVSFLKPSFSDAQLLQRAKLFLKTLKQKREEINPESLNGSRVYYPLYSIDRVRKRVEEFVNRHSEKGKAVVLLHAPSSGKTTAVLNHVNDLSQNKPVFFCYFTTRIAVAQSVAQRLGDLGFEVLFTDKFQYREKHKRFARYSYFEKEGNLSALKKQLLTLSPLPKKLAISTTFHSVVKTRYGKAVRHLISMLKFFKQKYPDGELILGIDEILGMDTSFSSYKDLLEELSKSKLLNDVRIFVFDASLFQGRIFEEEYKLKTENEKQAIPPHLAFGSYEEKYEAVLDGVPHRFEFLPTYPAKSLRVNHIEVFFEGDKRKEDFVDNISSLLSSLDISEGVGFYMQSIETILELERRLKEKGIEVEVIHTLRKPKIEKERVKNKVFLFTSALSRGVDLPVRHFYITVPDFNVETNLAELLQVFYRLRDGITDSTSDKEVNLLYPIKKDNPALSRLKMGAMKNLLENLLEAYISPRKEKTYKIPIPAVKNNFFAENLLSFLDRLRYLLIYSTMKNISIEPFLKIEGWTGKEIPKIHYPFAIFPKADLKIRLSIRGDLGLIGDLIESDDKIARETKKQLLEFLTQFDRGRLYIHTKSQFAIFLPNLIIPTEAIKPSLKDLTSITRLGYRLYPYRVYVDNKVIRQLFTPEHDQDLIGFFPSEEIGSFLPLPQIPLIFLSNILRKSEKEV